MILLYLYLLSTILVCIACYWLRGNNLQADDHVLSFLIACTWPMFACLAICVLTINILSEIIYITGVIGVRIRKKFN